MDYLYPPRCLICSQLLLTNDGFCIHCWSKLNFISEPFCQICSFEFSINYGPSNNHCIRCIDDRPHYDYARSLFRFDENSKKIIHAFKYYDRISIASIVAKMLLNQYGKTLPPIDLIIPVPMHKLKRVFRLYNHAQILSESLASLLEKKNQSDILRKVKYTRPQTGQTRRNRIVNLSDSILVEGKEKIRNKRILLIDDVITTGTTINLCAKLLKKAGAKQVIVWSIARTGL